MTFRNLARIGALAIFTATALSAQNKAWKMPRTADGHPVSKVSGTTRRVRRSNVRLSSLLNRR
jgi:hypothetical protein